MYFADTLPHYGKISADDISKYFFFFFQKIGFAKEIYVFTTMEAEGEGWDPVKLA